MRNRMYGGVRGRKAKVGGKLLRFPPTRLEEGFLALFYYFHTFLLFYLAISISFTIFASETNFNQLKPL